MSTGWRGFFEFVPESLRALRGHLTQRRGILNPAAVAAYFMGRSRQGDDEMSDIVASASTTYKRLMEGGLEPLAKRLADVSTQSTVIDFGCGDGSLLAILEQHRFRGDYIGFDFNEILVGTLAVTNSPTRRFESSLSVDQADFVFLVNVLAYTHDQDLAPLLKRAVGLLKQDAYLVIAEPSPAWYWESKFGGLHLRLRTADDVIRELGVFDLDLESLALASVSRIAKRPLLPVAWLGIWRRA